MAVNPPKQNIIVLFQCSFSFFHSVRDNIVIWDEIRLYVILSMTCLVRDPVDKN